MENHLSDWCQLKSLHVRPLSAVEGQVEATTLFALKVECSKSKKAIETYSCNQVLNIKDIKDSEVHVTVDNASDFSVSHEVILFFTTSYILGIHFN
ncbi:hypothetical protein N7449_004704 [Penicillium cf. viridicatum]|uniref:Uncharacterized protein n=1 Tax=Penicillium cf. viridicatum TaxID=2972119 RepID=A0A9W9SYN3_9EURO|nr:hypothetical protein N7449_004704 [Penicillium cf. viridicatum]